MKKIMLSVTMLLSINVFAYDLREPIHEQGYNENEYVEIMKIPVIKTEPNYVSEEIKKPVERCFDHEVREQRIERHETKDTNSIGIDTVIGGVAGVAIGNQIGHGSGKDAAKVVGGIGGAVIANNLRDSKPNYEERGNERRVEKRCEIEYVITREDRVVGYKNFFYLNKSLQFKVYDRMLDYVEVKTKYIW